MKKLILFLATLFTLSVSSYATDRNEIYVEQFDTVVVNVPAVIRCEYAKEYSIAIKTDFSNLYNYEVKNGSLIISSTGIRYDEIEKLSSSNLYLIIKHPYPVRLIEGLKHPKTFSKTKVKSGDQN